MTILCLNYTSMKKLCQHDYVQISVFIYSQMRYIKFTIIWKVVFIVYPELTRRKDSGDWIIHR